MESLWYSFIVFHTQSRCCDAHFKLNLLDVQLQWRENLSHYNSLLSLIKNQLKMPVISKMSHKEMLSVGDSTVGARTAIARHRCNRRCRHRWQPTTDWAGHQSYLQMVETSLNVVLISEYKVVNFTILFPEMGQSLPSIRISHIKMFTYKCNS